MSFVSRAKGAYAPKRDRIAAVRWLPVLLGVGCLMAGSLEWGGGREARAASKATREQGAVVFHEKGCEHCHGADAAGTERGPNLQGVGRFLKKPQMEHQIRQGGKEMPAFGDALNDEEVEQLVAFLSAQRKKGAKPVKAEGVQGPGN
jgi:mono/diheme cytochrome c family protein